MDPKVITLIKRTIMKRLYTVFAILVFGVTYTSAQIVTERCYHLDKIQFLQHKQDFWRSHKLFTTSASTAPSITGGYYNLTEVNYGFGLKDISVPFSRNHVGITTVNGLRLGNGLALGLGVGFLRYNYGDGDTGWLLPLYGDLRYYFGSQKNKFFLMADGGALFDFENNTNKFRTFVNPGAGITIPLTGKVNLSFGAGLMTQWVNFFDQRDSFINLKLGLLFGK